VVTTDAGGIPYIVSHEETCLMVPRGDHEAMAASALRLLEDNDLAVRLTRRAREASRKFTWPAVRDEWVSLYHELARERQKEADARRTGGGRAAESLPRLEAGESGSDGGR
jgi:glycosyltransferase involved in cell wall biosynthesis